MDELVIVSLFSSSARRPLRRGRRRAHAAIVSNPAPIAHIVPLATPSPSGRSRSCELEQSPTAPHPRHRTSNTSRGRSRGEPRWTASAAGVRDGWERMLPVVPHQWRGR
ncbi:hypothetical protein [Lysobacter gummosus]|uniref:hypothetical protein n=1 Tax=Lysobacter gummosus TaxID=262324 RepID=UPI00362C8D3A